MGILLLRLLGGMCFLAAGAIGAWPAAGIAHVSSIVVLCTGLGVLGGLLISIERHS